MIIKEYYKTREDGVKLYRTYSDTTPYLKQVETNRIYKEAIDVENAPYTYEETTEAEHNELQPDVKQTEIKNRLKSLLAKRTS